MPNHPNSYSNGIIYEHILKAEEKIGRYLKDDECVHHLDHNRENNSKENLLIFHSQADHTRFHNMGENLNDISYDSEGIAYCVNTKSYCKLCGKELSKKKYTYCFDCNHQLSKKCIRPSRDELKELIRNKSFVSIGKQFGVSDNAIRKWCDSYSLPRKATEIRKISDEDWEKI